LRHSAAFGGTTYLGFEDNLSGGAGSQAASFTTGHAASAITAGIGAFYHQ
jgi:hypothetical protein